MPFSARRRSLTISSDVPGWRCLTNASATGSALKDLALGRWIGGDHLFFLLLGFAGFLAALPLTLGHLTLLETIRASLARIAGQAKEIGRAPCRERGCQNGSNSGVHVS